MAQTEVSCYTSKLSKFMASINMEGNLLDSSTKSSICGLFSEENGHYEAEIYNQFVIDAMLGENLPLDVINIIGEYADSSVDLTL